MNRLYEQGWARNDRLVMLTDRDNPLAATRRDVIALWTTFCDGSRDAGVPPTVADFAAWLLGDQITDHLDEYDECEPAEVVW